MNKKQKNRKIILQNKRNKLINKRYTSTIKTLTKLFLLEIKKGEIEKQSKLSTPFQELNVDHFKKICLLGNALSSILDKSVKKKVIHKNTAARKKSNLEKKKQNFFLFEKSN
jgi:ribosomal protein S20